MKPILPDLLTFSDQSRVSSASWARRRAELFDAIVLNEYGGMPTESTSVEAILACEAGVYPERSIRYKTYEVRCSLDAGELSFTLRLWIPPGDGPYPVVLDGDGCWRYFNDQIIHTVVARGYIAASFSRTDLAADNKEKYRDTGLYRLMPDAGFGALSAWAWGYHRCIDALTSLDYVRPDQIAITGHSRGGKAVLLAGATDQRIAVTNPNCSGIGGSGLNHWKGKGSEMIDDFNKSGNIFWFGKGFAEYAGKDKKTPYDQHYLHGLVAPRGLLLTEAYGDRWANPPGSYSSCRAAEKVYELLDGSNNLGWSVREGEHAHSPSDYDALLDFLDMQFLGREVLREFKRELFPDLDRLLS